MTVQSAAPDTVRAGFRALMPLWIGIMPFGAVYAISALAAGLTPAQTLAMSVIVFAGASQFTAVGLFATGASPLSIILTTFIINARHLLLSASLAPYIRGEGIWRRLQLGSTLTDESYAVGMRAWLSNGGGANFLFGANMGVFVSWQLSTIAGMLIGAQLPDLSGYGLDLVFPLTFLAMLMPSLKDRASVATAVIAGIVAVIGALWLPGRWYVLIAGIVASACGALLSRRSPQLVIAEERLS